MVGSERCERYYQGFYFIFDSWFALNRLSDEAVDVDPDIVSEWLKPIEKGSVNIP